MRRGKGRNGLIRLVGPVALGGRVDRYSLPRESTGDLRATLSFLLREGSTLRLAAGTFLGWKVLASSDPAPVLHTMVPPPRDTDYGLKGTAPGPAVLSPDGTMIAFSAVDGEGTTRLYLRHLDQGESVSLSGTETVIVGLAGSTTSRGNVPPGPPGPRF